MKSIIWVILATLLALPVFARSKPAKAPAHLFLDAQYSSRDSIYNFDDLSGLITVADVDGLNGTHLANSLAQQLSYEKNKIITAEQTKTLHVGLKASLSRAVLFRYDKKTGDIVIVTSTPLTKTSVDMIEKLTDARTLEKAQQPQALQKSYVKQEKEFKPDALRDVDFYSQAQSAYPQLTPVAVGIQVKNFGAQLKTDKDQSVFLEQYHADNTFSPASNIDTTTLGFNNRLNDSTTTSFQVIKTSNTGFSGLTQNDTVFMGKLRIEFGNSN